MRLDDHRDVGRDLVVARAAGVELARERPDLVLEQALDRHVDVLVGLLEFEPALADPRPDPFEAGVDLLELLLAEDADPLQGAGVRLRLVDVVGGKPPIELDRAIEPPEAGVGVFAKARHQIALSVLTPREPRQTRSTWDSVICGKNGSASERREASSATGKSPSA